MRSIVRAALCIFILSAGCSNFSTDKTGSQQVDYDSTKGHFVPSNTWGSMNGEPMDMRKR
jgi:hypothetical protein